MNLLEAMCPWKEGLLLPIDLLASQPQMGRPAVSAAGSVSQQQNYLCPSVSVTEASSSGRPARLWACFLAGFRSAWLFESQVGIWPLRGNQIRVCSRYSP